MSELEPKLFSEESERILLSILINNPDKLNECYGLSSTMFSSTPNKIVYSMLLELYSDGLTPDITLVTELLKAKGVLAESGGSQYLSYLKELSPTETNFREFLRLVIDSYRARTLISLGSSVPNLINQSPDVGSVLTRVHKEVSKLLSGIGGDKTLTIKEAASLQWEEIKKRTETVGIIGYRTGFTSLDSAIGGATPGDLIVIAGRPSQGKTAWMCSSAASSGESSLIFSKEMGANMLLDRMISSVSGVPLSKIRQGTFSNDEEFNRVGEGVEKLKGKDIFIDSNFVSGISYIVNTIRSYYQQYGIRFVYIDYVQLLVERDESSTHEIGRVSRALKLLANELGIVVFLLSQLNRSVELRENKRPMLSDLRQSGNLEEDADIVIFLYRDEYYYEDTEAKGVLENIIRKNRNGPIGTVYLRFRPETVSITETKE